MRLSVGQHAWCAFPGEWRWEISEGRENYAVEISTVKPTCARQHRIIDEPANSAEREARIPIPGHGPRDIFALKRLRRWLTLPREVASVRA